jgi:proteasome lid subunit RPN8/RPN11
MAIRVKRIHLEEIKKHGEEAYPQECCGFLIGTREGEVNLVKQVYRAENEWQDWQARTTRYLITPSQYKRAEDYARQHKLQVIGYYHSHPDHPAQPSGFDFDHSCFADQSYVIVSVAKGKAGAVNSFTKPDYVEFVQEEMLVEE